jgi:acetylornithine deacetylase/succinyl-diaminopimelate desuccinylase-like protein
MLGFDKFKEHAKRILSIPSHAESGNEELVRYLQATMHDYGLKTAFQPVSHSSESISKRQANLIGFVSDSLVDRSTRRGHLFVNPLDVSTGNLPHLWTATQGNPQAPIVNEHGIVGAGAVQGKLDFLCRLFGAIDLLDKRVRSPIYLVGTCASHSGMAGSRFLIESLAVNPKTVHTFAPTGMRIQTGATGQVSYLVDLDSSIRERDSRGYNRSLTLTAYGLGADFSTPKNAINAFELLLDLLLQATENGFDFQWSFVEVKNASGTIPDIASAKIALTSFQFEDFKQFLRSRIGDEDQARFYRVDFEGITEVATRFIPSELVEVILELDHEWKGLLESLNRNEDQDFEWPSNAGALVRVQSSPNGKMRIAFELRMLPDVDPASMDGVWRETVKRVSGKYPNFHFTIHREYLVPGVKSDPGSDGRNTNYLSDAGLFRRAGFPVSITGCGSVENLPKGPNEAIRWSDLEGSIAIYRDLMIRLSQS